MAKRVTSTSSVRYQKKMKAEAVKYARKRLAQLLKRRGAIPSSARNEVLTEIERKFNIGCARAVERELKIKRTYESEEEVENRERGGIE